MAESTAVAEHHDLDSERQDEQAAGRNQPAAVAARPAEPLIEAELLVEEVSIDGMCGVY